MDRVDVTPTTTDGNTLHIYRVGDLSASCYGPVTAIEYCYSYSSTGGSGQPTFNWTVLILEDTGSNFMINNKLFIVSHPSGGNATCTSGGGPSTDCCDVTTIDSFDLPMNFIFGVTESAQGNTHSATLLGYQEAAHPQLIVSTIQVAKGNILTLPVGSMFPIPQSAIYLNLRGLRMLWFNIGKHQYYSLQYNKYTSFSLLFQCSIAISYISLQKMDYCFNNSKCYLNVTQHTYMCSLSLGMKLFPKVNRYYKPLSEFHSTTMLHAVCL